MNVKRFILASIIVFVAFEIMDLFVHMVLLKGTYETLQEIWRPDMNKLMWVMWVATLFFCFIFVYIFTKGYEGKGVMEGLRYGLLIGLLMMIVGNFSQYAVYPLPLCLVIQWTIYGLIEFIVCGIIVSLIYKPAEKKE